MKNFLIIPATFMAGILIFGMFAIFSITACHHPKYTPGDTSVHIDLGSYKAGKEKPFPPSIIDTEVIVWKNPTAKSADFDEWLNNKKAKLISLDTSACKFCSDTLLLLAGPNVKTIISDKAVAAGIPSGQTTQATGGGDDTAFFSFNIVIRLPEPYTRKDNDSSHLLRPAAPPHNVDSITVAIFDTGLDPLTKNLYTGIVKNCPNMLGGESGWNYIAGNNNTNDNEYPVFHGSRVSKLVIEQAGKQPAIKVNILPVKVQDSIGDGDLFHILCGFAYAANSGAKIINASFGFYSTDTSHAPSLLKAFVKHYLTDNNILMIAAAGNENFDEDKMFRDHFNGNPRDLNLHPFYPACLAKELDNVIAVTTVSLDLKKVSPDQNFSPLVVDIGVHCDMVAPDGNFAFISPLTTQELIFGSSYATPIVTGKVAKYYKQLLPSTGLFNKSILLQKMESLHIIHPDTDLSTAVRKGYYAKR